MISEEQKQKLKSKSAQALPNVPSAKGWTPQQFKDSITKVLFDKENSFYYHINKIVEEANKDFDKFEQDIKEIKSENSEFNGVKTFKGNVIFEQEVTLDYAPSSTFSAVNVGYVVNGYYNKSYIDDVVNEIKSSIDTINATQNVIDIVSTYYNLQSYVVDHPNTKILENDKIEVLSDESLNGANTIYKARIMENGSVAWVLVGSKSPYYSKTESDARYTTFDYLSNQLSNYANKKDYNYFENSNYFRSGNLYIISGANGGNLGVNSNNKLTFNSKELALKEDVGNSENLKEIEKRVSVLEYFNKGITYNDVVDSEEALVKAVPKGASPYALLNKIGGKTIKFNQIYKMISAFNKDYSGVFASVNLDNQTISYSGTANGIASGVGMFSSTNIDAMKKGIVGHKYLIRLNLKGTKPSRQDVFYAISLNGGTSLELKDEIVVCVKESFYSTLTVSDGIQVDFTIQPQIFDLTEMFGAGNEPTSVEEFNMYFPNEYYPYNEGEFIESKPTNVKIIGSNLLNPQNFNPTKTQTINGITFTINDDGTILCNGTSTSEAILSFVVRENALTLQAGTYNISGADENSWVQVKSIEDDALVIIDYGTSTNGYTFTFDKKHTIRLNLRVKAGVTLSNKIYKPMLVRGSTKMDFAQYKESNLPINVPFDDLSWSVKNYGNYIDFENKKYVRQIAQYVFTGDENWRISNDILYIELKSINSQIPLIIDSYAKYQVCNKFETTDLSSSNNLEGIRLYKSTVVHFRDSTLNTPELLKAYLKEQYDNGTPVILQYVVEATEQDISNIITRDNVIEVEGNGNIVFENTNNTSIPSELEYQVKVGV